ncbi:MAG: decaprenyl-phosphate phosphoribosyltransferase [Acidimicrobiaceae bacterium]|nr:decaprenyl-phosphate phosphoribosyltransferase [Acidimicrobiaceae bacterium]
MTQQSEIARPPAVGPDPASTRGPRSRLAGLARTARPKQWLKNVLVFAAPGAAGVLTHPKPLARVCLAFVAFCLAASGTYFLNDSLDYEADRAHPTKRNRPIAAGIVPLPLARATGAGLLALAILMSLAVPGATWHLALVVAVYVALTLSYSLWLKHQPVIDIAAVAAGFVVRTIAGGVAADVPISQWFLIVASFGSLFMVSGKRSAEYAEMGEERASTRVTLSYYTASFLRYVRGVTSSVAIAAYCLWAFEKADAATTHIWFELSIVPFVLGILRYALLLETGHGGAPEEVVLTDRTLQVLGVLWAVLFAVGVYAG